MNEIKTTEIETEVTVTTQNRWRSWATWVALLGLVGILLSATGVFEKIGVDETVWDEVVAAIGTVLTAFGIVNNPTSKNTF